jgi:Gram-negative bacterial TonB protein C-terminal
MRKLSTVLAFAIIVAAGTQAARAQNANAPPTPPLTATTANPAPLRLEHAEVPLYPEPARTANIFGTVEVLVTVKDGAVVNTEVISGPSILRQAATENIQSWNFAYHVNDTFTTKFVYQIAEVGDVANPKVESQLPYLVTITGVRVRSVGKGGKGTAAKGAPVDSRTVVPNPVPLSEKFAGDSQTVVPLPTPLIERFDVWGTLTTDSKLAFYNGWANGLFTTSKDPGTLTLGRCLEKLSFKQIQAMVDKRSANHSEGFKNPISTEMIEAVTAAGSPCEGIKLQKAKTFPLQQQD